MSSLNFTFTSSYWVLFFYCFILITIFFHFFLKLSFTLFFSFLNYPQIFHLSTLSCLCSGHHFKAADSNFFSFLEAYFCLSPGLSWPPQTRRICSHWTISQCGIAEQLSTQLDSFYTTCPDRRLEVEDIPLLSKKTKHTWVYKTLLVLFYFSTMFSRLSFILHLSSYSGSFAVLKSDQQLQSNNVNSHVCFSSHHTNT